MRGTEEVVGLGGQRDFLGVTLENEKLWCREEVDRGGWWGRDCPTEEAAETVSQRQEGVW